jgi:hypothetical protein
MQILLKDAIEKKNTRTDIRLRKMIFDSCTPFFNRRFIACTAVFPAEKTKRKNISMFYQTYSNLPCSNTRKVILSLELIWP